MWILDNSSLPTTEKIITRGLPLFSLGGTKEGNNSGVTIKPPGSEVIATPELVVHSEGFLYLFEDVDDLTEDMSETYTKSDFSFPYELNTFARNAVYTDTYIRSSESRNFSIVLEIYTNELEASGDYLYSYYPEITLGGVDHITTDGLTMSDVSYSDGLLTIQATNNCRPRTNDAESLTYIHGREKHSGFSKYFRVVVFDFSDELKWGEVNRIHSLDYKNSTFYESFTLQNYAAIYNPQNKLCMCVYPCGVNLHEFSLNN